MVASRRLIGLPYSPWSEKARWALDFHGVPYRFEKHVPMLGEPLLRFRTRRLTGRVSVPVLIDGRTVLGDSLAIARYADALGSGATLFPVEHEADIARWDARSGQALSELRFRLIDRILESPDLQQAELRGIFPRPLVRPLGPVASLGARFIARKYTDLRPPAGTLRRLLEDLRRALGQGGDYVLGALTYADLALSVVLQGVEPVSDQYIELQPATRSAWRDETLAHEFSDLVAWRNQIYERHRR